MIQKKALLSLVFSLLVLYALEPSAAQTDQLKSEAQEASSVAKSLPRSFSSKQTPEEFPAFTKKRESQSIEEKAAKKNHKAQKRAEEEQMLKKKRHSSRKTLTRICMAAATSGLVAIIIRLATMLVKFCYQEPEHRHAS